MQVVVLILVEYLNYNKILMKKLFLIVIIILVYGCVEDDYPIRPEVQTLMAIPIENGGIRLFGEINNLNSDASYGFILSKYKGGTLNLYNNTVINNLNISNGEFSVDIRDGLIEGQTYYFNVFVEHNNIDPYLQYVGTHIFGNEMSFISNGSTSPIINEVTPKIAHIGDTITVKGKYFSNEFNVYFNDKEAEMLLQTDSLTKVIVPFDNFRSEQYTNLSIKKRTQETTFFEGFSMYIPKIISVEPYYAHENDTITIKGNHFDLIKNQNVVAMEIFGNYYNLEIIESSRTEIKFFNKGSFYNLFPNMRLISQFKTIDFNDKFRAKLPKITGVPDCFSYGESITIFGEDFPRVGQNFNSQFQLNIGGVGFSAERISKDQIVLNVHDGFYSDLILEDVVIEYLGETITYNSEICVNEPWIKVSTENPQNEAHNYKNETYGVVFKNNNSFVTVGKLNTDNHQFESVINEQLPESIRYGDLRAWHQDKMYHYDISPNINKFYSYNFLNGNLIELTPFTGNQRFNGLMKCVGDYIYLGFGRSISSNKPNDDLWRYSITNNTWEFVLTFPGINLYEDAITDPLVFAFNNRLFFGGKNSNNKSNLFWEVNLNTFSLIAKANVPISAHGLKGVTIGNQGYFESTYLYEYDVSTDKWKKYEEIQGIGFFYPDSLESLFLNKGNIFRSVKTGSPYYNLMFKMNMNYLEE